VLAALSALLASCKRVEAEAQTAGATVGILVNPDPDPLIGDTKAADYSASASEKKITDYTILFFADRADGDVTLIKSGKPGKTSPLTFSLGGVSYDSYRVYAVCNCGDLVKGVKTEKELLALAVDLPAYNSHDDLIMIGYADLEVNSETASTTINVRRLVSRVSIRTVTNKLSQDLTLKAAYLTNVVGNQVLGETASASTWYNRYGLTEVPTSDIEGHTITTSTGCEPAVKTIGSSVEAGASTTLSECYLYCYPNTLATRQADQYEEGTAFSPTATYVVLEAVAATDGKTRYYQFPLSYNAEDKRKMFGIEGALDANHAYSVDVTIKTLGSEKITDLTTDGFLTVTITVIDWNTSSGVQTFEM